MSYWRSIAAPIIRQVIEEVGRNDARALRKALLDAYPFGTKRYHPYRIWRDEIRRQLEGRQHRRLKHEITAPGQLSLLACLKPINTPSTSGTQP